MQQQAATHAVPVATDLKEAGWKSMKASRGLAAVMSP